jgi:hypothetical protein
VAEKLLTVRVDAELYGRAVAGKPRGWVSEQVRAMLEREVTATAEPTLIDLGDEPATDDLRTMTVYGNSVTGIKEEYQHKFRRGKVLDTRWVKGVEEKLYACADECGVERWV